METAGSVLGYLADNPRDLEPFMNGGIMELPADLLQRHSLTWHATNGKIIHPAEPRRAQTVKKFYDRKPHVSGKRWSVSVNLGRRRNRENKKKTDTNAIQQ